MGRNYTHTHVYKGYKYSTQCAMIHAQYEYKHGKDRYITRAGLARTLYKRYKRSTHCAKVQPQYECKHKQIGTLPVLAMLNHCTKGTRTVRTVQWCTHSTSTNTGKRYIARADHARTLYKSYKHSTHCAMVQPQYEYKHGQK